MRDKAIEALKSYEKMQKAIFDGAQEPEIYKEHVPVGRCSRHPWIVTGNGMFDSTCNICESLNDEF